MRPHLHPACPTDHDPAPTALAQRAARALALSRAADPYHADRTPNKPTRRLRALMARNLAATLGVDPITVVATADPDRSYGGYPGHLLTVTDGDTLYRFAPAGGFSDDAFCLLGPCPSCDSEVPVVEVTQLADLGQHLSADPPADLDGDLYDRHHRPGCPHGRD